MSENKKYSADLLIIGGGVAGLTLTKLLAMGGLRVHVVEPYPPAPFSETSASSRTVALMESSLNILRGGGLSDFCEAYGTKMEVMRIIDDSVQGQDSITSEFDSFDLGMPYFSMNIPNSLLRARLFEDVCAMETVTVHAGKALVDYVRDGSCVRATLEDGIEISAPLIVGADGRESLVRKIAGIGASKKEYDQSAITCIINHSHSHKNTSTEFHRPGGPFALVPMAGNQSSVVWVEKTERADEIIKLSKDDFLAALQNATNDVLGGITLEVNPQSWSLSTLKAKALTDARVALIAEAAHVMSPITAQGLNLSLRDVAALAEILIDAARVGSDIGSASVLGAYEKRRRFDIDTRAFGVDRMNSIVSNDLPAVKDFRRIGLKIVSNFSPLKMMAMQHGLAPSLDQGRLVRGEAL